MALRLPMTPMRWPCWNWDPGNVLREPEQMSGFRIDVIRLDFAAPQSSNAVYLIA
jgi:hypothetical protein